MNERNVLEIMARAQTDALNRVEGQLGRLASATDRLAAAGHRTGPGLNRAQRATLGAGNAAARAGQQVQQSGRHVDASTRTWGRFGGVMAQLQTRIPILSSAFGSMAIRAVGATAALAGFAGAGALALRAITGAAQREQFEIQFEVLLGSADKAQARIAELVEFARTTPFEIPEVVQASRTLQVFTGGALATGEALRLIGDVASGTGQRFDEVAFWVGRLYDAMKNGQPVTEVVTALQRMGAVSGAARVKYQELAAGVLNGTLTIDQAWEGVEEDFSRFGGLMVQQAGSLSGKWSNLMDTIGTGLADLGTRGLPLFKKVLDGAITSLGLAFEATEKLLDALVLLEPVINGLSLVAVPLLVMWFGTKLVGAFAAARVAGVASALAVKAAWASALLGIPLLLDWINSEEGRKVFGGPEAAPRQFFGLAPPDPYEAFGIPREPPAPPTAPHVGDWGGKLEAMADATDRYAVSERGLAGAMANLTPQMERRWEALAGVKSIENVADTAGQIAVELVNGEKIVYDGAAAMMEGLPRAALRARIDAVEIMAQAPGAIADAIIANVNQLETANQTIIDILTGELDVMVTTAELKAYQAQIAAARGAAKGNPAFQAILDEQQRNIDATWIAIELNAHDKAFATAEGYSRALDLGAFLVEASAQGIVDKGSKVWDKAIEIAGNRGYNTVEQFAIALDEAKALIDSEKNRNAMQSRIDKLMDHEKEADAWGYAAGLAYDTGITRGLNAGYQMVYLGTGKIAGLMAATSPPGPESPLHEIDKWGYRTFQVWGEQGAAAIRDSASLIGHELGGIRMRVTPSVVGEGMAADARIQASQPLIPGGLEGRAIALLGELNATNHKQAGLLAKMAADDPNAAGELAARGELEALRWVD